MPTEKGFMGVQIGDRDTDEVVGRAEQAPQLADLVEDMGPT